MLLIKYYVVSKEIYSRQRIVMFLGRRKYATLKQRKTFPLFFAKNIFGVKISKKCRIVFSQINLFEKSCEKVSCKWGRFNYNWKNYIFIRKRWSLLVLIVDNWRIRLNHYQVKRYVLPIRNGLAYQPRIIIDDKLMLGEGIIFWKAKNWC